MDTLVFVGLNKKWLITLLWGVFSIANTYAQVGISNTAITPDASSVLELRSTTTGFLPPRMTTTQRDAITSPAIGLLIYNTTTTQLNYYTGSVWQAVSSGGAGTVTSASVTSANGFSGTVATSTTTPAITISTSVNGIAKGNGTSLSAAASGTDYSAGTSALATGILKSTTATGALSIATAGDFPTLNQNTTGNAATVTTNANLTGDVTSIGNATTLATVNPDIGTFNSVTVNAKGLITAASNTTTELTGKLNSDVNSTYPDNSTYWSSVTLANGFPVTGFLSGIRKGIAHTQRIQSESGERTFSRYWINASTAWSTWIEYIQKDDFAAKGDLLAGSATNNFTTLAVGANNTVLTADNTTATGLTYTATTGTGDVVRAISPIFTGTPTLPTGTVATTQIPGNNTTAVATTAFVAAAVSNASYKTILQASGSHTAARVAGTYAMGYGDPIAITGGTGTLYPLATIYISSADYPTVNGAAPDLRIRAQLYVNNVAPTGNYTFGLYPITRPAASGGAGLNIYTLGTVVAGSNGATFTAPAFDGLLNATSNDFALPADGHYVIGLVTTATVAASSHLHITASLQFRNN